MNVGFVDVFSVDVGSVDIGSDDVGSVDAIFILVLVSLENFNTLSQNH